MMNYWKPYEKREKKSMIITNSVQEHEAQVF
jgi:hypothetical protein